MGLLGNIARGFAGDMKHTVKVAAGKESIYKTAPKRQPDGRIAKKVISPKKVVKAVTVKRTKPKVTKARVTKVKVKPIRKAKPKRPIGFDFFS